jgi:hypothetical protein
MEASLIPPSHTENGRTRIAATAGSARKNGPSIPREANLHGYKWNAQEFFTFAAIVSPT